MKSVIVQVSKDYMCLTCCEPILKEKEQKKEATVDLSYRFTAPYIKPLDREYMEGKETVWEVPKAFATMVHDGLREMKRPEVKEVILLVEEFDLVTSEFQHARCNKKVLNSIAVDNLKEILQEEVSKFSVITTTYGTPPKEIPELTSRAFAIPRELSTELGRRFTEMGLTLQKIVPADVAALKVARDVVYTYNKTVCYLSIDYCALRVVLVRDSLPLYTHTYRSPLIEAVDIVAQDRQLSIPEAIKYIKQWGLDKDYNYNNPASMRRIDRLRDDIVTDIVHNINLVAMSLDLNIDQAVVSDYVGFFPHVAGTIKKLGVAKDVDVITDQFNTKMALPELDIDARDEQYKTGSYILFNNLMNCGDKYKNNLMVGLQPLKEKSINIGKRVTVAFTILVGLTVVSCSAFYAFLNVQKSMDEAKFKEEKYVSAADLLSKQADAKKKLEDQILDANKLTKAPVLMCETLEQTKKQVVDKVESIGGYSLTYSDGETDGTPEINVPVSGVINGFKEYLKLKENISEDGFFVIDNTINVSQSEDKGSKAYNFTLTLHNVVDTEEEQERYSTLKSSSAISVETATEAATNA